MRIFQRWSVRPELLALMLACDSAHAEAQFQAPPARLIEELRIDGQREDFSSVDHLFIARDGRIGVAQSKDANAVLFAPTGRRLSTIGRRGSGPGEFQAISMAGWHGDTIWITDNRSNRISTFTAAGKVITSKSFATIANSGMVSGLPSGAARYFPSAVRSDGGMLAIKGRGEADGDSPPIVVVRISPRYSVERVLMKLPPSNRTLIVRGAKFNLHSSAPFAYDPALLFSHDGQRLASISTTFSGVNGSVQLVAMTAAGDTLLVKSFPFRAKQMTQAEKEAVIADNVRKVKPPAPDPQFLKLYEAAVRSRVPSHHLPVVSAKFAQDHSILVQTPASASGEQWVLLSERGEPQFTVSMPPKAKLIQASQTTIWAVQLDEDDVPSVVRYRVQRSR